MIVVYAQATDRQGIDASIDGIAVDAADPRFVGARQKSKAVNLKQAAAESRGVVIHIGHGIVRVQIDPTETSGGSRVVAVLPSAQLLNHRDDLAEKLTETAAAIDHPVELSQAEAAITLATRVVEAAERRKTLLLGLSLALVAASLTALAVLLSRSR